MDVKQIFSKRLKELREERGVSQSQLAEQLGISRGSVSFYENADRTPDIETLDKVVKYFDVPIEYMLGYINTKQKENISIGTELGLSDKSIDKLKYFNENHRFITTFINFILVNNAFEDHLLLSQQYCSNDYMVSSINTEVLDMLQIKSAEMTKALTIEDIGLYTQIKNELASLVKHLSTKKTPTLEDRKCSLYAELNRMIGILTDEFFIFLSDGQQLNN